MPNQLEHQTSHLLAADAVATAVDRSTLYLLTTDTAVAGAPDRVRSDGQILL